VQPGANQLGKPVGAVPGWHLTELGAGRPRRGPALETDLAGLPRNGGRPVQIAYRHAPQAGKGFDPGIE